MLHPSPRPPREGGDPERGQPDIGVPQVWAPAFAGDADEGGRIALPSDRVRMLHPSPRPPRVPREGGDPEQDQPGLRSSTGLGPRLRGERGWRRL
jgi:hypothetical protein